MTAVLQVRPTIRCLTQGLAVGKLPPVDEALDRIDHVVLRKANAQFAVVEASTERIVAIDDVVLCKVKIQRWRGAVWRPLPQQWLVAAGRREAGSPEDFYTDLCERGRRWRAERNRTAPASLTTDTDVSPLLPVEADRKRLALEQTAQAARAYETVVPRLVRAAVVSGREECDEASGYRLAVVIQRRELDETYVGIRIVGPVSLADYAVILAEVPGTDPDGWFIDAMPHRPSEPGEIVWSNLIDLDSVAER